MSIDPIVLTGGLDLVTTPILMQPGRLLSASNYEPDINGGYKRIAGFERYDGRPRPSDANYYMSTVDITGSVSIGDTITGFTSSASAKVIDIESATSLVVTKYSGTFIDDEIITVSGSPQGTISDIDVNAASTSILHARYKNLAADQYRNDIGKPTGSGMILGAWHYNGDEYCFRNNVGGTEANMWKATGSGWTQITFGREIQFTGAVGEILEGDTVTGATSAATGVVKRALLRTGTWSSSGVGTLVFDSVTGLFQNGENIQVSGVTKVVANGADTAITLQPGGRFEFDNYNFTGTASTKRMYFADGVNYIHEFDGHRIVPIRTGIGSDSPKFVKGHKNQLFCAVGSSIQVSGIGDPYSWTALTGAAELGLGDECTGLLPQVGDQTTGVLVASTDTRIYILYGNDSSDFNLVVHAPNTGAKSYTLQNIGYAYFLDRRGITQLQSSQVFGGFELSNITRLIQPIIDEKKGKQVASCIIGDTNQYRLFFNDGTGIILQIGSGNAVSLMFFDYGSSVYMNQVCTFEDDDGTERIIAAGSDGYVYELNRGTSFDGNVIASHIFTVFTHSKSIRMIKRYRRTVLHAKASNTARVRIGYDLSYGSNDTSYGSQLSASVTSPGGYWDGFRWEQYFWDSPYIQELNIDTPGNGESIALIVAGETDEDEPYTVHTAIIHYLQGRQNR